VIFPIEVRDILFWFAHHDLYTPKWSKHIFDEWADVMIRKGVQKDECEKRLKRANKAFPDALAQNYEPLIQSLDLPDPKDRHVLAAAIKVNANQIVTNNLKDFPSDYLETFGLTAKSADDFLTDIIDLNQGKALEAFQELVLYRRSPDMDEYQVLDRFRRNSLKDTANYLHSLL